MSLFYLYNPKFYIDPHWRVIQEEVEKKRDEWERKKKPSPEFKAIGVVDSLLPKNSIATDELKGRAGAFIGVSSKLVQVQKELESEKLAGEKLAQLLAQQEDLYQQKLAIANTILEMNEEEEIMLLSLLVH